MSCSPTKNQIIAELYKSKEFNDCINKMEPAHLRDDLRAEVMLILLEKPEAEICSIYKTGGMKFYAVRIILNQIQSDTSPFYKKYRTANAELKDNIIDVWREEAGEELWLREVKELREERAINIIESLYWYDKEIVRLYIQLGSYRAIEKETGIKWQSCYDTVQMAINKIRYELRKSAS